MPLSALKKFFTKKQPQNNNVSVTFNVIGGIDVFITYNLPPGQEAILAALLFDINAGLFSQTAYQRILMDLPDSQKINFVNQTNLLYREGEPVVDPCNVFQQQSILNGPK
jgi:hypothetical protein